MKTENLVLFALIFVGLGALAARYALTGAHTGLGYVEEVYYGDQGPYKFISHDATSARHRIEQIQQSEKLSDAQKKLLASRVRFSWSRTIGIWVAAFFTLAVLSFLYKDNPFYKIAEHAFVGISAAYWMVVAFWTTVVQNLFGKLFPYWTKFTLVPGLNLDEITEVLATKSWLVWLIPYDQAAGDGLTASTLQLMNVWYWIPMILGVMLLWRLAPKGGWIARWPLAFTIGTTAGLRLIAYLESDFIKQIEATLLPLYNPVYDPQTGALDAYHTVVASMNNILIVLGVMCGLLYFFFSLEHRGLVGRASRVGIWVLMITFGAGFGYTVMGRIALLVGRFQFLVQDWLRLSTS